MTAQNATRRYWSDAEIARGIDLRKQLKPWWEIAKELGRAESATQRTISMNMTPKERSHVNAALGGRKSAERNSIPWPEVDPVPWPEGLKYPELRFK